MPVTQTGPGVQILSPQFLSISVSQCQRCSVGLPSNATTTMTGPSDEGSAEILPPPPHRAFTDPISTTVDWRDPESPQLSSGLPPFFPPAPSSRSQPHTATPTPTLTIPQCLSACTCATIQSELYNLNGLSSLALCIRCMELHVKSYDSFKITH